ncbi:MAG: HNH endonuclease signature motif containing protein [Deltaproteobacteria bacterium]|nr:HNH endonuclease signature motif containing protein [Deltaproteobacteria bacterium]
MKRELSTEFKKARREMIERKTKCHECEDYAADLHHIIAVEDGGTDDIENLMPLCKKCHKEYTSEQTTERNKLWVELNIDDDGEVTARCSGDKHVEHLGNIGSAEFKSVPLVDIERETTTAVPVHYEYEWIVTVEIPAMSERESKEKLNKFKSELFHRYAATDDVWLTGIRRWNGKK